jgi:peptide chain release factor 3
VTRLKLDDARVATMLDAELRAQLMEDVELLDALGGELDLEAVHAGKLTPVFFGSAMNNFGVQLLLDRFLELSPSPMPRESGALTIDPASDEFSAFVFKIQANMNPKHRDRIAFVRIVSGKFERDMDVVNCRTGEKVRLANSQRLFARERETVDDAYAGDVVGLVGNYDLLIGDTLASTPGVTFDEIPRFAPECFSFLHNKSTAKYKRFRDGLQQLLKEGVASEFQLLDTEGPQIPLLGAVGPLQFEVLQYRLEGEYAAETRIEPANWSLARWLKPKEGDPLAPEARPSLSLGAVLARDSNGWLVALLPSEWALKTFSDKNEDWIISEQPFAPPVTKQ